jgi:hypothetical protein
MSSVKRRKKEQESNEDADTSIATNAANESVNDEPQDINGDETSEEDKVTKRIRKALRRIGKHMRMDHEDEMPNGFEFPSKDEVLSLGKKQKETFFDEAAACSEKIVGLTTRILDAFGNSKKKKNSSATARAAIKGFEQAELWRQVSGFSRHCCSKALRAMHEVEEAGRPAVKGDEGDEESDRDDDSDEDVGADLGADEAAEEEDGAARRTEVCMRAQHAERA